MSLRKSKSLAKDDAVWAASMHKSHQRHQQFNWQVLRYWEETHGADPAEIAQKVVSGNGNDLEKRLVAGFCRWARKVAENLYFTDGCVQRYTPSQVVRSDMSVLEGRAHDRLVYLALNVQENRAKLNHEPNNRERNERDLAEAEQVFNDTYHTLLTAGLIEEEKDFYVELAANLFSQKYS
ncbi:MAG: hypothetical protein U0522_01960 [Candidatus Paceibacterota bacterium]